MIAGYVDVDKIVMQHEWDEDREARKFGIANPLDADETDLSIEEIINESY